jgi:hypothetical protein
MAIRNQPYIPLYVQDYLTDEKLNECSAAAQGIYIKLMCVMHKSEPYGCILLRQNTKQNESTCHDFAIKLVRHLPFSETEITSALEELVCEGVVTIEGAKLYQKRMVRDNELSLLRAEAGKKGGFAKAKHLAKGMAKNVANTEYEIEDENENIEDKIKRREFVFTTEKQHQTLLEKHGDKRVSRMYDILNAYIPNMGRQKYVCHYSAINSWVVGEEKKRFPVSDL